MKKELSIFIGLFVFLTFGMHFEQWIDHPIQHLLAIQSGGAFGIPGILHPIVFTLIQYIIVGIPRALGKIFSKKA